ncbi:zinc metallochaperone AztD [Homoserinibacter sp. YIM 151385]|uniref:zinc metallochaperone AztD n=1 Tax=Homoserinibacter sp. YIM 151385 TaxID=2985506 RepID=UPI0022F07488|nr:zinc metallochaperone AztD [Homoserinibacter sp. YIM 151385]WBU38068.1 zinc metallochaperone AztD [Homoserinibacter sp. YIM 151385]
MRRHRIITAAGALAAAGLLLSGCATSAAPDAAPDETDGQAAGARIAVTYEGGIAVLDAATLEQVAELPIEGFTRVNPVGDGRHVMVTTAEGFQLLDTAAGTTGEPELTELVIPADAAGHVVPHAGTTVLFDDATGDATLFDTDAFLGSHEAPESEVVESEDAHHGVALQLEDGTLLTTIGDSESRSGVRALGAGRKEITRNEECPGVHGEGTAAGEVAVFGCEDGVLVYAAGAFEKLAAPDEFGRIGNQFTTHDSPVALGDYNDDPDAEGYVLSSFSLIDTAAGELSVHEAPAGYTFRDLARGPHDEALLLGTDGALHVIDPATGETTASFPLIDAWEGPAEWQDAHPALKVWEHSALVTDPASDRLLAVDVDSGEITATAQLAAAPVELAVAG